MSSLARTEPAMQPAAPTTENSAVRAVKLLRAAMPSKETAAVGMTAYSPDSSPMPAPVKLSTLQEEEPAPKAADPPATPKKRNSSMTPMSCPSAPKRARPAMRLMPLCVLEPGVCPCLCACCA